MKFPISVFFLAVAVALLLGCAPGRVEAGSVPGDYVHVQRYANARCAFYAGSVQFDDVIPVGVCHDPFSANETAQTYEGIRVYGYNATDNTIRVDFFCSSNTSCDPWTCAEKRVVPFDACAPVGFYSFWIRPAAAPSGAVASPGAAPPSTGAAPRLRFALAGLVAWLSLWTHVDVK